MEGHAVQQIADLFGLLSHPARLRILNKLRQGEACVCHLAASLQQRQPYVSRQLTLLREGRATASRKDGAFVYYRLANPRAALLLDTMLGPTGQKTRPAECTCPACQ